MSIVSKLSGVIACFSIVACSPTLASTPANTPSTPATTVPGDNQPVIENPGNGMVAFATAKSIVDQHCVVCHSQSPTQPNFSSPAGGVSFDTPAEIKAKASRIRARAVNSTSMPQGNVTNMTDAERETLGKWIEEGANL